jgi:hypothetical protein
MRWWVLQRTEGLRLPRQAGFFQTFAASGTVAIRLATAQSSAIAAVPLLQIHHFDQAFAERGKQGLCSERHCRDWLAKDAIQRHRVGTGLLFWRS